MIISIPCSKKVFNIWCSILIIAAFCCKFPGPIIGLFVLIFFVFMKLIEKFKLKKKEKCLIETGILPVETIGAITLALKETIRQMDLVNFKSFKSQYSFIKMTLLNYFPDTFDDSSKEYSLEEIRPILQYIENQIAFIKEQMTETNKDVLNEQLNAYFILLVFCYSKFYKDIEIISKELFEKLN